MIAIDKSKWPIGEWTDEPDFLSWKTDEGFHALIIRSNFGHLCGYVGVPGNHSKYGFDYENMDIGTHCGLTYSKSGIIEYEEDPSYWYFGFDCAHYGDICPSMLVPTSAYETYKNIDYVKSKIASLSKQLFEA